MRTRRNVPRGTSRDHALKKGVRTYLIWGDWETPPSLCRREVLFQGRLRRVHVSRGTPPPDTADQKTPQYRNTTDGIGQTRRLIPHHTRPAAMPNRDGFYAENKALEECRGWCV